MSDVRPAPSTQPAGAAADAARAATPRAQGAPGALERLLDPHGPLHTRLADAAGAQLGRIHVELRIAGLLGQAWLVGTAQATLWAWLAAGDGVAARELPWVQLLLPQVLALVLVFAQLFATLPEVRWPRRGSLVRTRSPWPSLVLGLPALAVAPLLIWRDRRVQRARAGLARDAVDHGFYHLLQAPQRLGLHFLAWVGLADLIVALVLGDALGWAPTQIWLVALVAVASLGPLSAIVTARAHVLLRPELLTAPRARASARTRFDRDLRLGLGLPAAIAVAGSIAAPLLGGVLWMQVAGASVGVTEARHAAEDLLRLARLGELEAVGRVLARHRGAWLETPAGRWGARADVQLDGMGARDLDGDRLPELWVAREADGRAVAAVPIAAVEPLDLRSLLLAGLVVAAAGVAAVVLVAVDVHRDVVRATRQVSAVARGQAPPPMLESSISTRELRTLVRSVDRLVSRMTEGNVAKYVAIERAKEAERLKNQFLANMSHDLRSPLNSILGFSELLLTGIDGEITPEQRKMVQTIHDSGRDLLQEIDDILDTAKIEAKRLELHPEPTPPATLLSRAVANARKRLRAPVTFDAQVAAGLPPAFVDPYRTVQALENVLLFACERMDEGAVTVTVRPGQTDAGRVIAIRVNTPVRPATAEHLARARRGFSRIPGHRGLGLGLPIADAIVTRQGGSLAIEDLGEGMVFTLHLPAPETRRGLRLQPTA